MVDGIVSPPDTAQVIQQMQKMLAQQKQAYQRQPYPSLQQRLERLSRLRQMIEKYQDDFAQAISEDFGNRSLDETRLAETITCLSHIDYYSNNIHQWMKSSKRHIGIYHQPAKGWVSYQPLGVIGIISPWNYPLLLAMGPLICAFAAGNHAMIKPSSAVPRFGALLAKAIAETFSPDLVTVINGGGAISDAFSRLPFDKIAFTGSTEVGKTIMQNASQNLTPVLLELGGKSPVVVQQDMSIAIVAQRLAFGKLWNAGQTCVAPDYIFLPQGKTAEFVEQFRLLVESFYPTLKDNPDYTSIVNPQQYHRLQGYLENARQQGADVIEINPKNEDLTDVHKIAPTLLTNVTADMHIMQNEIFGPILPILEYQSMDEVLTFITQRPRPLALYYFDDNEQRALDFASKTHSGHFGHNQVLTHVAQDDLPFGGVGASGMGKYHGPEGFFSFSHTRSMMYNPNFYGVKFIFPPFNRKLHRVLYKILLGQQS